MTTKRLCEAINRKNQGCKNQALPGSHFCENHQDPEHPRPAPSARWEQVKAARESGELHPPADQEDD